MKDGKRCTMDTRARASRGQVLLLALGFTAILLISIASLVSFVTLDNRSERLSVASAQALALSEAGIDEAVYQLNQNGSYTGETTSLPTGTFTTSIATINSNTKRVTSTGYVPNATNPIATRTVQATLSINTSVVSFNTGVQVGDGGLTMNNGSQIIGNVASNGPISGSGTITNTAIVSGPAAATINQQWATQNSSFNIGDISSHGAVAQSFKPSLSGYLTQVNLYLKKTGTPHDLPILILSDNSGNPSTTVLGSGTIASTSIAQSYGFVTLTLPTVIALTQNQSYWIVASSTAADASNYVTWGMDSGSGYSAGAGAYTSMWSVPLWSTVSGDLDFQAYMKTYGALSGVQVNGDAYAHTLLNCSVGGNAYYQSITSCPVAGTSHPGSTDQSPGSLPVSNTQITQWEGAAGGGTSVAGPYTISGTQTLGPAKINGDLSVSGTLILSGPVWVNGNITFSNGARLTVSGSAGGSGAVLIADATGNTAIKGTVGLSNNVTVTGDGQSGSYPMIISTNSSSNAIQLSNNATGVILFASAGTIQLSNNASASQLTGYAIQLNNNATITYITGLQNASFTNGPGGSWAYLPGTYAITQ